MRSIIVSMPRAAPAKKKACAAYQRTVSEISPTGGRNMLMPERRNAVSREKPAHHSRKVMFFIAEETLGPGPPAAAPEGERYEKERPPPNLPEKKPPPNLPEGRLTRRTGPHQTSPRGG